MEALKIYMSLVDKVMDQSTPDECELLGDHMRRVIEALKPE